MSIYLFIVEFIAALGVSILVIPYIVWFIIVEIFNVPVYYFCIKNAHIYQERCKQIDKGGDPIPIF